MHLQSRHEMSKETQEIAHSLRLRGMANVTDFLCKARQQNVAVSRNDVLGFIDGVRSPRQYYTPDEVAQFMATIGMRHHPRSVLDPACGVGNLLYYCSTAEQIVGIDIDRGLSPVTSLLCPEADLRHADFLNTDRDRAFDLVVMDPPWGLLDRDPRTPYEQRMVEKALECLAPDGVLVALVPPSFLWSDRTAALREVVLRDFCLEAIVSLWPGALRTTSIGGAVVVIGKRPREARVFVAVADGPHDLPLLATAIGHKGSPSTIETAMLAESWNPARLLLARAESQSAIQYKPLSELADVIPGVALPAEQRRANGDFLVFSPRHIHGGRLSSEASNAEYISAEIAKRRPQCIAVPGDIVMYLRFTPGQIYIIKEDDPRCIIPDGFAVVRSDLSSYIRAFLSTTEHQELVLDKARAYARGSVIKSLSLADVQHLRIPILPIDDSSDLDPDSLRRKTPDEQAELLDALVEVDQDHATEIARAAKSDSTGFGGEVGRMYLVDASHLEATLHSHPENDPVIAAMAQVLLDIVKDGHACNEKLDRAFARAEQNFSCLNHTVQHDGEETREAVAHVQTEVTEVHSDTGQILSMLRGLEANIADIKGAQGESDEKLDSMWSIIDLYRQRLCNVGTDMASYAGSAASLIPSWKSMEELSQQALTMAEYLLDNFKRIGERIDYSPCVLEYSKALENELLKKVFIRFVDDLKTPSTAGYFRRDLDAEIRDGGKSVKFAKAVQLALDHGESLRFTLGDMLYELRYARNYTDARRSLVRSQFKSYLSSHTDADHLLAQADLTKMVQFKDIYRNPCAHPELLNREDAVGCRSVLPGNIEWVLTTATAPPLSGT